MKRFKRQIDLIRYAVRRAVHRYDMKTIERIMQAKEHMKKNDWLQWADQKLKGLR